MSATSVRRLDSLHPDSLHSDSQSGGSVARRGDGCHFMFRLFDSFDTPGASQRRFRQKNARRTALSFSRVALAVSLLSSTLRAAWRTWRFSPDVLMSTSK